MARSMVSNGPIAEVEPRPAVVRFTRWSQPVEATLYLKGKRWSVTMDQGFRRGFTAAEKTELWDRWQRGESLKAIGRAFGNLPDFGSQFGTSIWPSQMLDL